MLLVGEQATREALDRATGRTDVPHVTPSYGSTRRGRSTAAFILDQQA